MSNGLRIVILLGCAYAGWQTASVQLPELPKSQPQEVSPKIETTTSDPT
jgi:hypothetical protein